MIANLWDGNLIALGFLATIGTGLATGVGALPVLITTRISDRLLDGMLAFAIMMLMDNLFG